MFARQDGAAAGAARDRSRDQGRDQGPDRQAPAALARVLRPGGLAHATPAGVRALGSSAGNAAAVFALGGRLPVQRAGGADGRRPEPRYRMQIQVKKSARKHERNYWDQVAVGHSWIALYTDTGDGREKWKTYGFYPAAPVMQPFQTVPGQVKHNEESPNDATSKFTAELTQEQFDKAKTYMEANKAHEYNLATYNCTTFARGVYQAATGRSAPGLGLPLLENPNLLQDSIKRNNQRSGAPRQGETIFAWQGSDSEEETDGARRKQEIFGGAGAANAAGAAR